MIRSVLSRALFVPAGAVKFADKSSDAVAFLYTNASGRPCARIFYGKQSKPVLACYYQSAAQREAAVVRAFETRRAWAARRSQDAAARKAAVPAYGVGAILSTCWGYDQTNREFYEVTKISGKAVTVRQIGTETIATGDMTDRVIPLPGAFVGPEIRRIFTGGSLKISTC